MKIIILLLYECTNTRYEYGAPRRRVSTATAAMLGATRGRGAVPTTVSSLFM